VLGADLLAGQYVSISLTVEMLDDEAVQSDDLSLDAEENGDGWAFSLPPQPGGAGDLAFTRCRTGA